VVGLQLRSSKGVPGLLSELHDNVLESNLLLNTGA